MKKSNLEEFIEKAKKVHGEKYDYRKVDYINNHTKVCIICPEHGEFLCTPHNHLKGRGCPECAKLMRVETWRISNNKPKKEPKKKKTLLDKGFEFERRSRDVHGKKYIYHPEEYQGFGVKTRITCPIHGDFYQTPGNHLAGKGCMKCANEKHRSDRLSNTEDFIKKATKLHNGKYDYSLVEYVDAHTPVKIICPEHGVFEQTPNEHLNSKGCAKCSKCAKVTVEDFKERASEIYNNFYDYSKVTKFDNTKSKVEVICPLHGSFIVEVQSHLRGHGCPSCENNKSIPEDELYDMISGYGFEVIRKDRKILSGKEVDLYIPSCNLGIEYDGLVWHSEKYRMDRYYHINKLEGCNKKGINLITIFEDEWLEHEDLVREKIKYILGIKENKKVCGARECSIEIIKTKTAKEFLNKYHIQGFGSGTIYYGAYNKKDGILVGVMAFREDHEKWELTRFATDYHYSCPGLGSKILKRFIKDFSPKYIKSFADRRWTLNKKDNLYTKLGFELDKIEKIDYNYTIQKKRLHKFGFRKQILHKKYGLPLTMTESEMCREIKAYRIWNCGLFKYVWQKEKASE